MPIKLHVNQLQVQVLGDFNYVAVCELKKLLAQQQSPIQSLHIDLRYAKFVNSEGVAFIHQIKRQGVQLTLINTPENLFEVLEILGLDLGLLAQ